jgi:RNA polymerase sigma-70 factor (ECF subfamily)
LKGDTRISRELEFEQVAMPQVASLLRTALRLTGDRGSAEDFVQEVLLRAWSSFHQFETGTDCKAWLFRILLNLASKRQKRTRTRPYLVSLEENEAFNPGTMINNPPEFTRVEAVTALDALPEEHRIVLMLAIVEGFTCKEISQMLAVPMGTVMSRLSRAREGLRKKLMESRGCGAIGSSRDLKRHEKRAYELL